MRTRTLINLHKTTKRRGAVSEMFLGWVMILFACSTTSAAEGKVLHSMDRNDFRPPEAKGAIEVVPGRSGRALKFSFEDDCRNVFFRSRILGGPEWDEAAGFSFWVKGDGSDHLGGIEVVWNGNYALRYAVAFPIDSTEWRKITVPWRDLIPEKGIPGAEWINPENGNAPSKLGALWFGKWWYWRDYAAHSYTIDDIRLEKEIPLDNTDYAPKGPPLQRFRSKLRKGQPVTIVTMGDSLTDYRHWANRETNWPTLLKQMIDARYRSEVTIVNPAIGGTELRPNLVLMPRWLKQAPEPDLVTVCFGFNDFESGMTPEIFLDTWKFAVKRIRRMTNGKADVLIITTCPAAVKWNELAGLAHACRDAAGAANAGLADTYAAFHQAAGDDPEQLFARDRTHLGPEGHALFARTVLEAIESAGR